MEVNEIIALTIKRDLSRFETLEQLIEAVDIEGVGVEVWNLRVLDALELMKRLNINPSTLTLYYDKYRMIRELKRVFKDFETTIGLWEYKLYSDTGKEKLIHIHPDVLEADSLEAVIKVIDKEKIGYEEWVRRMDILRARVELVFPTFKTFIDLYYPKYLLMKEFVKQQFHFHIIFLIIYFKMYKRTSITYDFKRANHKERAESSDSFQ